MADSRQHDLEGAPVEEPDVTVTEASTTRIKLETENAKVAYTEAAWKKNLSEPKLFIQNRMRVTADCGLTPEEWSKELEALTTAAKSDADARQAKRQAAYVGS